jgi:hypothetical protein
MKKIIYNMMKIINKRIITILILKMVLNAPHKVDGIRKNINVS